MAFNVLIWVNLTYTTGYEPMFEIIYFVEITLILLILLSVPVAIIAVWRAVPMHANTRVIYISFLTHCFFASTARIPLIYHQAYGQSMDDVLYQLVFASIVREFIFTYITTLVNMLAFDRLAATFAWARYEKQTTSSLITVIILLITAETFNLATSIFIILKYITLATHFAIQTFGAVFGYLAFTLVYVLNWKLLGRHKVRLAYSQYNVNRIYQLRENLMVMRVISKLVFMTPFIYIPPFTLFMLSLIIKNQFLQCFFKALFDLAVSLFYAALILRLLTADRRFERGLRSIAIFDELYKCRRRSEVSINTSVTTVHRDEQALHFTQLSKDWATTRF